MKSKTLEKALTEIDEKYRELIKKEKREYKKGKRKNYHVTWDGNLW